MVFANINEHVLTTTDNPLEAWDELFQVNIPFLNLIFIYFEYSKGGLLNTVIRVHFSGNCTLNEDILILT